MKIFDNIKINRPKSNLFDLSHEKKLSLDMGNIYPMFMEEVLPGDRFKVSSEILIRMAPMLAPIMHRVNVYTHYFFVPYRLLWSEWEDFITGGPDGQLAPTFPYIPYNDGSSPYFAKGMLSDYLGIPPVPAGMVGTININLLPFRAYNMIWNEYYRDQNLTDKVPIRTTGGEVNGEEIDYIVSILKRAWEKDYFTSALPWAQRGGTVGVPMQQESQPQFYELDGDPYNPGSAQNLQSNTTGKLVSQDLTQLVMDSGNTVNINDLRTALNLQKWLERNARGGSRYIEQILSHFGVRSSDARLQRPEYLGGGVSPVVISEVLSTVGTTAAGIEAPQGNMAGHGISVGRTNTFNRSFEEHGLVMGLISVLPRTAYQQGLERLWRKTDKFDYFWPEFAHLGEQEIKRSELYVDPAGDNNSTFGYQSRYAEYKYKASQVNGDFRDDLDFWHMGRKFASKPSLNADFVQADPTNRIYAVTEDVDHMYCQIYHNFKAIRPIPYYSIPSL